MKKIYNYGNCTVTIFIPEDDELQERLRAASEKFMRKVLVEREKINGNFDTSRNIGKEQILD